MLRLLQAPLAFEDERFGDDTDGQRADAACEIGDDRSSTCTGAAAHSGGDEDHVGALERGEDAIAILERGLPPDLRIRARAEALGHLRAELDLSRSAVVLQRLAVGVGGDEVDAGEPGHDHRVERVAAAAAHADHLDLGAQVRLGNLVFHGFKPS